MKVFLIRNRYNLFNLQKILNTNFYGLLFMTPFEIELREILKQNKSLWHNFRLSNNFIKLLFNINTFTLFAGPIYYLAFSNLNNCVNFYKHLQKKKNNFFDLSCKN